MTTVDQVYEEAVASGLIPGASLVAGNINGKVCTFLYLFGRLRRTFILTQRKGVVVSVAILQRIFSHLHRSNYHANRRSYILEVIRESEPKRRRQSPIY